MKKLLEMMFTLFLSIIGGQANGEQPKGRELWRGVLNCEDENHPHFANLMKDASCPCRFLPAWFVWPV